MSRLLARLVPILFAALLALTGRAARAEPPAMKEHQQHPRLEVASKDGRYSVAVGGFFQARYAATFPFGVCVASGMLMRPSMHLNTRIAVGCSAR
jgi:hypothetical protein